MKITRRRKHQNDEITAKKYQEISEPNKKQYVYAELEPAFLQSKSTICGYRKDSSGTQEGEANYILNSYKKEYKLRMGIWVEASDVF